MRKIYFIINPKAKNGYCLKIWKEIEFRMKETSLVYFAFFTEYPGHAKLIAAQIAAKSSPQECSVVIAVGGDGTLHEVMNGMVKNSLTLGFIPGGSGNDFSRGLEIPSDPVQALEVILRLAKAELPRIDSGKITFADQTEHYFINNMGAGFDALISYEVNRSRMKALLNRISLGRMIYVFFLIKLLFSYRPSALEIQVDGKKYTFTDAWFVTVSNHPFYGGGMRIAPQAVPDDGILDIVVAHGLPKWKLLLVFMSVFSGKHTRFKEVKMLKGRTVSIDSSEPLFVHADGEFIGKTPLAIHVQPGAINVITRRRSGWWESANESQEGREMSEQT